MASKVLIVMGSISDYGALEPAWKVLGDLGIDFDARVASAHRTPDRVSELAHAARAAGYGVIIAGAGGAAHLAGVIAAHTTLPVVAAPVVVGSLGGMDALLSATQMPGGVPVAAVGIGGALNAGLFAAAVLAAQDAELAQRLTEFRQARAKKVAAADEQLQVKLGRAG